MSALLDPIERAHITQLGVRPGWRCLELGSGNGSIAQALAEHVAPTGHVVASDIDLRFIVDLQMPCLEIRQIDILHDSVEEGSYDFVVMITALKPGGALLSMEPDMLPCTVAEPHSMHTFWEGWLRWWVEGSLNVQHVAGAKGTRRSSTADQIGQDTGHRVCGSWSPRC